MIVSDESKDIDWQTFKAKHAAASAPIDSEREAEIAESMDNIMDALVGLPPPRAQDNHHNQDNKHQ